MPQTLNMLFWNQCSRHLISTKGTKASDVLYQPKELDPQTLYIYHGIWILILKRTEYYHVKMAQGEARIMVVPMEYNKHGMIHMVNIIHS